MIPGHELKDQNTMNTLIHAQSGVLTKNIYKSYDLILAQQSYYSIAALGSNSGMGFHSTSDILKIRN